MLLELSILDLNLDPAIKSHPDVSQAGSCINACTSNRNTLIGGPVCQHWSLVDVKDRMVSFTRSRQVIVCTLNKFQIPALTV